MQHFASVFFLLLMCNPMWLFNSKSKKFFTAEHNRTTLYNPTVLNRVVHFFCMSISKHQTCSMCIHEDLHLHYTPSQKLNLSPRVTNLFIGWNSISVVVVCSIGSVGFGYCFFFSYQRSFFVVS